MSRRFASLVMLLALVLATLVACGAPAGTDTGQTGATTSAGGAETAATPATAGDTAATPAAVETEAPTEAATEAPEETTAAETTAAETATAGGATGAGETAAAGAAAGAGETATAGAGGAATELPNVANLNIGTVKIASQSPLSGEQSALGTGIRNGVQLAVEQMAPKLGLQVTLEAKDDQALPDVGAANANAIAADPEILCVAGHLNSGVALAALPTYKNANLTMVSPANTNPNITDDFPDTAFRVVGRDDVQGVVGENFARDNLNVKSVYILHDKTDYGQGIATFFREQAEKDGIQVLGFEGTEERAAFDAILTPILGLQPDLVYWGGLYPQGGPIVKQMREKGIQAQFMGPDGIDSDQFAALAGEAAVGVHYSTVAGPPSEYPAAAQFAQDYQARFGATAPSFSPQGYDSASACMIAIAKAAQAAGGKPTREQVNAAMQDLGSFNGVTGEIRFDEKGDRVPATYFIAQVVSADPANWGNNKIITKLEIAPPGE